MKKSSFCDSKPFPSFPRRGGCAHKENVAKPPQRAQTGWLITCRSSVVNKPPRPLHQRWLRVIFLMSRPPLLEKEGTASQSRCRWAPARLAVTTFCRRSAAILVLLCLSASAIRAQAYRAPRAPDGKPNLNGIWQALNEAYWDIEGHGPAPGRVLALGAADAVPPGIGVVEGGPLPYLPEAAAKKKQNFENRLTLDPEIKCYLPGVTSAMYMPQPLQIVQRAKHIMIQLL